MSCAFVTPNFTYMIMFFIVTSWRFWSRLIILPGQCNMNTQNIIPLSIHWVTSVPKSLDYFYVWCNKRRTQFKKRENQKIRNWNIYLSIFDWVWLCVISCPFLEERKDIQKIMLTFCFWQECMCCNPNHNQNHVVTILLLFVLHQCHFNFCVCLMEGVLKRITKGDIEDYTSCWILCLVTSPLSPTPTHNNCFITDFYNSFQRRSHKQNTQFHKFS